MKKPKKKHAKHRKAPYKKGFPTSEASRFRTDLDSKCATHTSPRRQDSAKKAVWRGGDNTIGTSIMPTSSSSIRSHSWTYMTKRSQLEQQLKPPTKANNIPWAGCVQASTYGRRLCWDRHSLAASQANLLQDRAKVETQKNSEPMMAKKLWGMDIQDAHKSFGQA